MCCLTAAGKCCASHQPNGNLEALPEQRCLVMLRKPTAEIKHLQQSAVNAVLGAQLLQASSTQSHVPHATGGSAHHEACSCMFRDRHIAAACGYAGNVWQTVQDHGTLAVSAASAQCGHWCKDVFMYTARQMTAHLARRRGTLLTSTAPMCSLAVWPQPGRWRRTKPALVQQPPWRLTAQQDIQC